MENLDLFSSSENTNFDDKPDTRLTIYNNQVKNDMSINEIFDSKKYSKLIAVTYSASPAFINRYLTDFKNLDIVIGANDQIAQKVSDSLVQSTLDNIMRIQKGDSIKDFMKLDSTMQDRMFKTFNEYVPVRSVIHSKFYLLNDEKEEHTRLILGSANLSTQAFSKETAQFENIIVLDDHPLFEIFQNYYHEQLEPHLVSYFPKEDVEKVYTRKIKHVSKKAKVPKTTADVVYVADLDDDQKEYDEEQVPQLTNDDVETIKTHQIKHVYEQLSKEHLPEEELDQMQKAGEQIVPLQKATQEEYRLQKQAYNAIKQSMTTHKKKPALKTPQRVAEVLKKTIVVNVPLNEGSNDSIDRMVLLNDDFSRSINNTGLKIESKLDQTKHTLIPFGKRTDSETIKSTLQSIDALLKGYQQFTSHYSDNYGKRIMEAILYSFTAPFITSIRRKYHHTNERSDIPLFLFIGGNGGSGKTTLLKACIDLTLPSTTDPNQKFVVTNNLSTKGNSPKQSVLDNILNIMVHSDNNVTPIYYDEIEPWTFEGKYSRTFVNIDNQIAPDTEEENHPVLIGTTNATTYSLGSAEQRRSYYLKIDHQFEPDLRGESNQYLNQIHFDNHLFEDFCKRMSDYLSDQSYDWEQVNQQGGKVDFLTTTRKIFRNYYHEANLPVPAYFPDKRCDDNSETNRERWYTLYYAHPELFEFNQQTKTLFVKISELNKNKTLYRSESISETYRKAMIGNAIKTNSSEVLELYPAEFFEWIGIKNPYKHQSFAERIKSVFNS